MDFQRNKYQQKSLFTKVAELLLTTVIGLLTALIFYVAVLVYLFILEKGML